ncbi:MAG: hypothetical protein H0U57_03355 [Tatlockia sp.]|nr:hypothetical protein [Tatlockia sp.]
MRFYTLSCLILSILFSPQLFSKPIVGSVDGGQNFGKQLHCKVYLHQSTPLEKNPEGKKTLLFQQSGTGIYTTYFDEVKGASDYYLTFDKPGISPDFKSKNRSKPKVDRNLFDFYTINNLTLCAENALTWADNYLNHVDKMIILQGHSEGSVVMSSLALRLLKTSPEQKLQSELKALFLSGIAMKNLTKVLHYQLKEMHDETMSYEQMMKAYKTRNFDFIHNNMEVGWYWLDNVLNNKTRGIEIILSDIAKFDKGRALPIEFFQGLEDKLINAKWAIEFETKNKAAPANKQLTINARYYNSDHGLNETAIADMQLKREYYFKL